MTEALTMDEFNTSKFLADSEQHAPTNSTDISENRTETVTVTIPSLEKIHINPVTAHKSWNIKQTQVGRATRTSETADEAFIEELANVQESETTESIIKIHGRSEFPDVMVSQIRQSVEKLSSFSEESPVRNKNFEENFQSTVNDARAIVNTDESTSGKESGRFFLRVKEMTKHRSELVTKASPSLINISLVREPFEKLSRIASNWTNFSPEEILNKETSMDKFEPKQEHEIIPPPESFRTNDSTRIDIDNLDAVHYNSASSEQGTFMTTEIYRNTLATEMSHSSKGNEFSENNYNFSSYSQEELLADSKSTNTVVSSVQNDNLFPNISVEGRKSLQDKFGTSLVSMKKIPISGSDSTIDNFHSSSQDGNYSGKFTLNFKTSSDIQFNYATTTKPLDLTISERSIKMDIDNDNIGYTDGDLNTSAGNNHYTSITWKDYTDYIGTVSNNVDTTVTSSYVAETVGIDRSTDATIFQQTLLSLIDNIHMNSDHIMHGNWNQKSDEKFETDKLQQVQLTVQQTNSDKTTIAVALHPETVQIETEAKEGWLEGNDNVENDFRINKMQSQETSIVIQLSLTKIT